MKTKPSLLEDAILLAVQAHHGKRDKGDQPYVLHLLRVMLRFNTEPERVVAVLHDLVEDTPITPVELAEMGYGPTILDALECLSKQKDEEYDRFIERVRTNPLARRVKIADLEDNMDLRRLRSIDGEDLERTHKYQRAWRFLVDVERS